MPLSDGGDGPQSVIHARMKDKLFPILVLSIGVGVAAAGDFTGETRVYKQVEDRALRLYLDKPAGWKAGDQRPAIVFFFGGGWVAGNVNQFQAQSEYLATRGMVGIRVEYRVLSKSDKGPPVVCCRDAKSAMRWVRAHAAELGVDPQRIAASGGSAGGHLAAFATMVEGMDDPADDVRISPKANALVLFNPVFDNGPEGGYGTARIRDRCKEFSPAHNITPATPPTVVFLGDSDRLISTNVLARFKANMTKAGVRCDPHVYAGQPHGFFNEEPYKSITLIEADKFLGSLGWLEGEPTLTQLAITKPAATPAMQKSGGSKPNIIFILADDLGAMDIGANNHTTFYETPNIDALAAKGMNFKQSYAACPVCSPTRASILTGKYPARVGVTAHIGARQPDKWDRTTKLLPAPYQEFLALEEVTLGEALRDAGYTNFFAGKWHLGDGEFYPGAQGFDPQLKMMGKGQFYYPPAAPPTDRKKDGKTTDRIADAAVRFIDANKDRPFFAYLPFQAVHIPISARPELVAKYERKKSAAPPDAWGVERDSKVRRVQNHAGYAAMLEQMDTAIGRVLAALDRNHLADRTVVVFTSDNGGLSTAEGHPTSNLPLRAGKGWLYEGGIRVPMIIRAPGVTKPGSVCETPVTSTDFYPTLLELAGLPLRPRQHLDGRSLVPLLKGDSLARGPLFWHYPHYGNQGDAPGGGVRDGDWKLIEWYEGAVELYDLAKDLEEQNNLAVENPKKVRELQAKLAAWRRQVAAIMPTPNPNFDPDSKPPLKTGHNSKE
jgi:arylsulfatase A-like enzyme/acetyl esterase/lipase